MTQRGSLERTKDTKYVVSYWHIPQGSDYQNAAAVVRFFSSVEEGTEFEKKNMYPPEMAIGFSIEEYDKSQSRIRK